MPIETLYLPSSIPVSIIVVFFQPTLSDTRPSDGGSNCPPPQKTSDHTLVVVEIIERFSGSTIISETPLFWPLKGSKKQEYSPNHSSVLYCERNKIYILGSCSWQSVNSRMSDSKMETCMKIQRRSVTTVAEFIEKQKKSQESSI